MSDEQVKGIAELKTSAEKRANYRKSHGEHLNRRAVFELLDDIDTLEQALAALEARNGENAALLGALKLALVTIDAFWPNDRPENQAQVDEDRAIAKVRKLARAAIAEAKKENK